MLNGQYEKRRWQLDGDWAILKYDRDTAWRCLLMARSIWRICCSIDSLIVAWPFSRRRSGAAPSDHLFDLWSPWESELM